MENTEFVKENTPVNLAYLRYHREDLNSNASSMPGDFLARLWTLFGEPNNIHYEGFTYGVRHIPTNISFNAYSGPSGPAYGSAESNEENLRAILEAFEKLLDTTQLADCEITYQNDWGTVLCGAKDGKPYDHLEEDEVEVLD